MANEYKGNGVTVTRWPVWFQKCFLAADAHARCTGRGATYSAAAYAQSARGDLIVATRIGTSDPSFWTLPDKRHSFFFLGSTAPTNAKDFEYAGVGSRPSELTVYWLSYFFQHKRKLNKEGEGFVHCWGQAADWDGALGDAGEQLRLENQIKALTRP